MPKIYLINVGANSAHRSRARSPLFPDGSFVYVPFPLEDGEAGIWPYSPTTMYEDYLISHDLFHWQSQSNTSEQSPTGQRYIRHSELGYTPLLFVRETKSLPSGLSAPYHFLGPCKYVKHTGSRPISITWKLLQSVPTRLLRTMARQIAV